jgi:hypothetical protein
MNRTVNKELYDLCKGFKNLAPDQKKGVLLNAKGLLEVQRNGKALIAEGSVPLPVTVRNRGND